MLGDNSAFNFVLIYSLKHRTMLNINHSSIFGGVEYDAGIGKTN